MLNLGTLEFVLGVNTRALDAAKSRIQAFGDAVSSVQGKANRGYETNIAQLRKAENAILRAAGRVNTLTAQINKSNLAPNVKLDMITKLNQEFNNLSKSIANAGKTADSTKFDRNIAKFGNSIQSLTNEFGSANTKMSELAKVATNNERALQRQENALARNIEKIRNLSNSIQNSGLQSGQKIQLDDQLSGIAAGARNSLGGGTPLDSRAFNTVSNQISAQLGNLRRQFKDFQAEAKAPALDNWEAFRKNMQGLGSTMLLINGHLGGMSTRMFALGSIMGNYGAAVGLAAAATVGLGVTMQTLVTNTLQVAMKFEKVEKALGAVTKSAAITATQLAFVQEVSNQAGLKFTDVAASYSKYLAASRAAGQTYEQTAEQFKGVALAAGTMSLTVEDTQGVFKALEQILSKGTVQSEELRGQLGDRFPGAFAIAAKAVGVTTSALNDMLKKGQVISKEFVPAFVKAMTTEYNISLDKPIDTLQAALNRGTNALDVFFLSISRNTEVVAAAKTVLNAFAGVLGYLAENMSTIVRVMAGVTGAVFGATAAFIALRVVLASWAALTFVIGWLQSFISLAVTVRTVTQAWALAQVALNTAMLANPIGAIIGILARLAVVLAGAIWGYNALTGAVDASNAAAGQTESIRQYINMQKSLGYQVRETTNDLIKQAIVLAKNAAMKAKGTAAELRDAAAGPGMEDYFAAFASARGGVGITVKQAHTQRLQGLMSKNANAVKDMFDMGAMLNGITSIGKLPTEMPGLGMTGAGDGPGGKGGKGGKGAQANIDAVKELVANLDTLKLKYQQINEGPKIFDKIDNLAKAKQMLGELSTQELAMTSDALTKAGFSAGTLEERMVNMLNSIDAGTKSIEAFAAAWEEVDAAVSDLKVLDEKIAFANSGGSLDFLYQFDNMQRAKDAIKDLNEEALKALADKLTALGYISGTLPEKLADLWNALDAGDQKLAAIQEAVGMVDDLNKAIAETALINEGIRSGVSSEKLDQWVERQAALRDYRAQLDKTGLSYEQVMSKMDEFRGKLDLQDKQLADEKRLKDLLAFREGVAQAMADAAGQIVRNFKNIGDAVKNMLNRILDMIIEQFIVNPIFDQLSELFKKTFSPSNSSSGGGGGVTDALATIFSAFSQGGFAAGGYTGAGGRNKLAGAVHKGEYVFDADAVNRIGVSTLQAMNSGVSFPSSGAGAPGVKEAVHIYLHPSTDFIAQVEAMASGAARIEIVENASTLIQASRDSTVSALERPSIR